MFQEIAIILIGIGVVIYVGWKIYKLFTTPRIPGSPCSGCQGCELKNEIDSVRRPAGCPTAGAEGFPKKHRPQPKRRNHCSCA